MPDVQRESAKLQKESTLLLEAVRTEVGTLAVRKREFESFDERVQTLQSSVADTEVRVESVAAKDKNLNALSQKVDALTTRFENLFAQADDLTQKQLSLDSLYDRFAQLDDLSKKAVVHSETLKQSRADLDGLRKDVQEFYKSHAEIVQLRDKLASDRHGLESFGERMGAMAARAPELDSKMDAILAKMALVEDGTQKATRLGEVVADLDTQLSRVSRRACRSWRSSRRGSTA